ncbi:MAG TPA: amidophosphoribosyltransferase [Elusimicrobiota bacterium]|nr:amidophosphoribosyltransferase [Elusimicrobiota bacterium]
MKIGPRPSFALPFDRMPEECGVFGIYNHAEASRLAYLGIHQLQHRGQESAGIVTTDGKRFYTHVAMGLVADVFNRPLLDDMKGRTAIGHVRYGTSGVSSLVNAQPIVVTTSRGPMALAHNGNLTNALLLRRQLEKEGSIFQTSSDSEVILHLVAKSSARDLGAALKEAFSQVEGAYSIVLLTPKTLFVARDPWGVRPLHIGRLNGSFVVASETCAFDIINARLVREVKPGEIVAIDGQGIRPIAQLSSTRLAHCIFEFVYFSRPDSRIFGRSVYEVRRELGRQLARESPVKADVVVAVPDSSSCAAVGYAERSGLPLELGLIRSHYVGRTFIEPKQAIRDFGARMKYSAVADAVRGKRIVLVDDSIVRGTTSRKLVRMLRRVGVKEIHLRISSPPILGPCFYGIDTPETKELIAARLSVEKIREYLRADSLKYLSLGGMLKATKMNPGDFCTACFTARYPIPLRTNGTIK